MFSADVKKKFISFVFVGGFATGLQYAILVGCVQLFSMSPTWASSLGFAISSIFNYTLNYYFTFRSSTKHIEAVAKFAVISATGLVLNGAIMEAGITLLDWHYVLVQIVATIIVMFWNFLGNHLWSFRVHAH